MSQLIPIPARTPAAKCSSCGQAIFFAPHPATGRPHPISIEHEDAEAPTPFADGIGISHFSDCPSADQHRAARATVPVRQLRRDLAPTTPLARAELLPLMGRPESWHGKGGQPLGAVDDSILRQAKRFFERCLLEGANPRMTQQLEAIALILADREANSPQGSLSL